MFVLVYQHLNRGHVLVGIHNDHKSCIAINVQAFPSMKVEVRMQKGVKIKALKKLSRIISSKPFGDNGQK